MDGALVDVVNARDAVKGWRRRYHLALVIATERGHTPEQIAEALDTDPLYVSNTIRLHREGKCGCRPGE